MVTKNPAQGSFEKGTQSGRAEADSPGLSSQQKTALARGVTTGYSQAVVQAEAAKTLKDAVNRVVLLYSYARKGDVHEFVETYTWRPVANMIQIFGTPDLKIEAVEEWDTKWVRASSRAPYREILQFTSAATSLLPGSSGLVSGTLGAASKQVPATDWVQKTKLLKKRYKKTVYQVTSGTEGFHSRAFGDYDDLFGLVTPNVKKVLGLERRSQKVLATLDTRKEKRAAVRAYVAALEKSRGIRG